MYYYSQEARAYALLILFCAAAFVLWQRALQDAGRAPSGAVGGVSSLALLTHYFAAFLSVRRRPSWRGSVGWRRTSAPVGAVVVVGLALCRWPRAQRASGKVHWMEERSLPSRVAETAKLFVVGVYGPLEIVSAVLAALLAAGAVAPAGCAGTIASGDGARGRDRAAVAIALPLLLGGDPRDRCVRRAQRDRHLDCLRRCSSACGLGQPAQGRSGTLLGAGCARSRWR